MTTQQSLYKILGLPFDPSTTPADLKTAYHRSLLSHHPDKSSTTSQPITIDAIKSAYATLSNPPTRKAYDQELLLTSTKKPNGSGTEAALTGEEVVDLDDLAYDEERECYWRACRCGDSRGFVVTENDLEREVPDGRGQGEVLVQCGGCSLWLRIGFGVADEDEKDGENRAVNNQSHEKAGG
jgi:diphthamide biosynthesis protein 4